MTKPPFKLRQKLVYTSNASSRKPSLLHLLLTTKNIVLSTAMKLSLGGRNDFRARLRVFVFDAVLFACMCRILQMSREVIHVTANVLGFVDS